MNNRQKPAATSLTCHPAMSQPHVYAASAPMPTSAKALLNAIDAQAAMPPAVPNPGPRLRSMKK